MKNLVVEIQDGRLQLSTRQVVLYRPMAYVAGGPLLLAGQRGHYCSMAYEAYGPLLYEWTDG